MKEFNMKKIQITIKHNLTPMHEEILEKSLFAMVKALETFWEVNSKKDFIVNLDKSMGVYSPVPTVLTATALDATTFCVQCKKIKTEIYQHQTVTGDWCQCLNSLTALTK